MQDRKRAARAHALSILARCDPIAAGRAVGERITASQRIPAGAVVAGFFPLNREIDMTPLLQALRRAGHVAALPRTPARGQPLSFHRWAEGDALASERFGTITSSGPLVKPDVLLVPLLAFDRRGYRLGYGGGYYDRTIALRPHVATIGCAYAALELDEVPAEPTDVTLCCIATEDEFITIKTPPCESSS